MLDRLMRRGINAELMVTFVFIIVSGLYIEAKYGAGEIINILFLWMFPASIMIFLTLLLVKIIERWHDKKVKSFRYLDWRR